MVNLKAYDKRVVTQTNVSVPKIDIELGKYKTSNVKTNDQASIVSKVDSGNIDLSVFVNDKSKSILLDESKDINSLLGKSTIISEDGSRISFSKKEKGYDDIVKYYDQNGNIFKILRKDGSCELLLNKNTYYYNSEGGKVGGVPNIFKIDDFRNNDNATKRLVHVADKVVILPNGLKEYYDAEGLMKKELEDGSYEYYGEKPDYDCSRITYLLDQNNKLIKTSFTNGVGEEIVTEYKDNSKKTYINGNLKHEILADGSIRNYDENGNITDITYNNQAKTRFDENGNIFNITSSDGSARQYDESGNLDYEWDSKGISKAYDEQGNVERIKYPDGRATEYDENGNITVTYSKDRTVNYYDENGNVRRKYIPNYADIDYDENHNISRMTYPNSSSTGYDKDGNVDEIKYPDGTERRYDANGNLRYERIPDKISRHYYENGNISGVTYPNGSSTSYDENGNITEIRNSDGTYTRYDENGVPK